MNRNQVNGKARQLDTETRIDARHHAGTSRQTELRRILEDRRRDLVADLQQRVRQRVATDSPVVEVVDSAELAEADMQDDLRLSLMQMKAELLERVQQALVRLESGSFGMCIDCGDEISDRRLRALPFALRCTACEQEGERLTRASHTTPRFGSVYESYGASYTPAST